MNKICKKTYESMQKKLINEKKNIKNNKAITLVALIITIIILLILAGVAINFTIGPNGIFNKSKKSVEKYEMEEAKEKIEISIQDLIMEKTQNGEDFPTLGEVVNKLMEEKIIIGIDTENQSEDIAVGEGGDITGDSVIVITEKKFLAKITLKENWQYEVEMLGKYRTEAENDTINPTVQAKYDQATKMLEISVQDEESGIAEITVERKVSDENNSNTSTSLVKTFTYEEKYTTKEEKLKVVAPYQKYLKEINVTAKDKGGNQASYPITGLNIFGDEYVITTETELQQLATEVNNGKNCLGLTIQLGNDIDLSKIENFTPIGETNNSSKSFKGSFNGNGYTISNMTINRDEYYTGLFGYVNTGASIENVRIKDCNITGNKTHVGGLVGYNNGGKISKVVVSGKIDNKFIATNSGAYVGGLIGYSGNEGTIDNCYSQVNITTEGRYIGGLVGYLNSGTITNCYSIGKVTGSSNIGGLVGGSGGTITNSYWTKETSGVEKSSYGESVLLSALTQKEFYQDKWDFNSVWEIEEGKTTPYLKGMGDAEEIKTALEGYEIMKGIGTASNPYQITNVKQLSLINYELEEHYVLEKDVNLEKIENFTPIGNNSNKFTGSFNGKGHTISNLKINRDENYTGLFGYVNTGASIENVRIKDCSITGNGRYVGGLVGYNYAGKISKVAVSGKIDNNYDGSDYAYVGGLIGYSGNEGTIDNCYSQVQVEAQRTRIGGLVGYLSSGTITNCYSIGKVTGSSSVGGLVGSSGGTITNSYWTKDTSGVEKNSYGETALLSALTQREFYQDKWDFNSVWEIEEGKTTPYLKGMGDSEEIKTALKEYEIMKGLGTESSPYQITNGKQLVLMNYELGSHYELVNDINLENEGITNFTPIGNNSNKFTGSFNGKGHTINKLQINRDENYTGLFGYVVTGASIENVRIKDCSITGNKQYVGGLVGYNTGGIISKVAVSGKIDNDYSAGDGYVGGLIGYNGSGGTIDNCYSQVQVEAQGTRIGGLVGYLYSGTITNCYSTGIVTGSSSVGGLVGARSSGTVTSSYWDTQTSEIQATTSTAKGVGKTTEDMKKQETYEGWDFSIIWKIENGNYPELR